jgi:hypothetical protein
MSSRESFLFEHFFCTYIYLPHAQTAIYDSKVKLFLKQGISHQLGRDAVVRLECENSAIDVIINFYEKYSTSQSTIVLVVLTSSLRMR